MRLRGILAAALTLALMWLAWGVYFVAPDEEAVTRVLGKVRPTAAGPGLHWNWPRPVGRVDKLKVREAKRLTLGFAAADRVLGGDATPAEARWLTGDRNVVHVRLVVLYAIHDPLAYSLRFADVESLLETSGRSALLEVVAGMGVDELLTTGKVAVQQSVQAASQELFDRFGTGVTVLSASLEGVSPPSLVREAFNDVASAREDRDRLIREAESYRNEVVPVARGEARALVAGAESFRTAEVERATGEADRFRSIANADQGARAEIRTRTYLETMERVLPRMRKTILEPGQSTIDIDFLRRELTPGSNGQP
ncbi:MAG: FtsH protease activity modulator HflK [Acidobacteria bacterium]|nr:FtsH protease activity modulator HflK [Acidobacteriota bacterium]